jgi:hypothetical protein
MYRITGHYPMAPSASRHTDTLAEPMLPPALDGRAAVWHFRRRRSPQLLVTVFSNWADRMP